MHKYHRMQFQNVSSSIDNLPQNLDKHIGGYMISFENAEKLGIKIRIDEKFKSVGRGRNVALIWKENAYQWITFDDVQKLTWNLSEPIVKRNEVIDDQSAELLVDNGTFFRISNPALTLQEYAKFIKNFQSLMAKYEEPLKKLAVTGQKLHAALNPPEMEQFRKTMAAMSRITSTIKPLVAAENLVSIRDSTDILKNILTTSKDEIEVPVNEEEIENTSETATSLKIDLENSADYDEASEHLSDYSIACSDAQASSQIMMEIAEEIEKTEKDEIKMDKLLLDKIWEKIRGGWEILKQKVSDIIKRIGGSVRGLGSSIKESLDELNNALGKGIKMVADAFKKVGEQLYNLINKLLKQMFQFLNTFTRLAKEYGWGVKEVQFKLPSIKLKMVSLVVVSIPLPMIDPPDVTITFQPIPSQSK